MDFTVGSFCRSKYKVAVDAEEGRRRREDGMIEIRKSKREKNLLKKRREGFKFPNASPAAQEKSLHVFILWSCNFEISIRSTVKGAKVVTDRTTGRSKGYGFVRFADESDQLRAMTEMNGVVCSTRAMRIGPAANKKPATGVQPYQKAPSQSPQGSQGESDPNNTTIFVGGLDTSVQDEHSRQVFSPYGELVHVKIPVGKRCGFVQFANRGNVEQALASLNGSQLGGQSIRLSWGRSPSNKKSDQPQWNGGGAAAGGAYPYGYQQSGYEAYGYAPPAQDPNVYYGGYPGYPNYQQAQQQNAIHPLRR